MDRYAGGLGDWLERPTSRRCRGLCKFRRTGEIRSGLRCRLEQGHEFGSLRLGQVSPERTPTADLSRGRGPRSSLPARRDVELQYAADAEIRCRYGAKIGDVQSIVGPKCHTPGYVESRYHIFNLSGVLHAHHLALSKSGETGRSGQFKRIEQAIGANIDRHHCRESCLGVHDVIALSGTEAGRELMVEVSVLDGHDPRHAGG